MMYVKQTIQTRLRELDRMEVRLKNQINSMEEDLKMVNGTLDELKKEKEELQTFLEQK